MTTAPHGRRTVREMFLERVADHVASVKKATAVIERLRKKYPRKPEWEVQVMASSENDFRVEVGNQGYYAREAGMYGLAAILQQLEAMHKDQCNQLERIYNTQSLMLDEVRKLLKGVNDSRS